MKEKVKFLIVGAGRIGKRHIEMVLGNPSTELVGIVDILPKELLEIERYDAPFFSSIEDFVASGIEFDIASICTPNGLHADQSLKILEQKKHVLCEKPMGLTKSSCEEVIFKSLQVSKHVFCVMQNRYSPPSQWIKSVIEDQLLGEIYFVQINCYWNRDARYYKPGGWKGTKELDGGTLFTQFSHFIDIFYWLFGDIKNINAQFANFSHEGVTEFEDSGFIHFDFGKKGKGLLNYSTAVVRQNLESSLTIIGEKGSVKIGGQYMDKVEICDIENYTMPELPPTNPSNDYGAYKGSAANHQFVIQNVVDTINGKNVATTNALEGMKVVEIIERIYEKNK